MASLALHHSRTLFPKFRFPWQKPAVAAALLPTFLTPQAPFNWAIPSLQSLLELFPPFLLAVPKKKVSHSRKAMRSADKGLKDKHSTYIPSQSSDLPAADAWPLRHRQLPGMWHAKALTSSMCRMLHELDAPVEKGWSYFRGTRRGYSNGAYHWRFYTGNPLICSFVFLGPCDENGEACASYELVASPGQWDLVNAGLVEEEHGL